MRLLTNSRLRIYRECERKHDIMFRQAIRPLREGEALRFGSLLHAGLEAWWRGEGLDGALAAVQVESDPFDRVKAEELLRGYDAHWISPPEDVIGVEVEFRAPMLNPETGAASRTWQHAGKIDALIPNVVIEHKSTSESIADDSDHYWQRLAMDHQISGYVVGAEALGHEIKATLYDVVKKPSLRPLKATPVESRKYTKDGRLYASQREWDESAEEYAVRLREDIAVDPERYFQRRVIPRLDSQILDYRLDAWQAGRAIREAELAGRAPRNPEACFRYGRCAFWDHCANGLDLTTSPDFVLVENVHPELTQQEREDNGDSTSEAAA
jgi:hypothetical protein